MTRMTASELARYISFVDDVKEGDIVEKRRFDFPRETVKIVFHDYVEPED